MGAVEIMCSAVAMDPGETMRADGTMVFGAATGAIERMAARMVASALYAAGMKTAHMCQRHDGRRRNDEP